MISGMVNFDHALIASAATIEASMKFENSFEETTDQIDKAIVLGWITRGTKRYL